MKIALVTAIFGGIDVKKNQPIQVVKDAEVTEYFYSEENFDFYPEDTPDRIKALYFKSQHFKIIRGYDVYVWVDGKIQIITDDFIQQCIDALGDGDLAIMKHLYRSCVYEEVDHILHCINHNNDYLTTRYAHRPIRSQVEQYRAAGYPAGNGLNDCCIMAMRNTGIMQEVYNRWWEDCRADLFDQTAIQFRAWEAGVKIKPIEFQYGSFVDIPHIALK